MVRAHRISRSGFYTGKVLSALSQEAAGTRTGAVRLVEDTADYSRCSDRLTYLSCIIQRLPLVTSAPSGHCSNILLRYPAT